VGVFSARSFGRMSALPVRATAKDGKERGMMIRRFHLGAWLLAAAALGVTVDYGRC
jgi:hypothetical protein